MNYYRRTLLRRFFPLPRYLSLPAFGLDISDHSVKFAELVWRKGELRLGTFGKETLAPGVIERGEIKHKESLEATLRSVRERMRGQRYAIVSLPEERAYVSIMQLPVMRASEIPVAIESQLEEYVPIAPDAAIFDYEKLPPDPFVDHHVDIAVSVFPLGLAELYRDVLHGAGIVPLAFEIETHALARAALPFGERRVALLVDIGNARTSFAVVKDGFVRFSATVTLGGKDFDAILSKSFGVDAAAAHALKEREGVAWVSGNYKNKEVFNALLPIISAIKDEVARHMTYWNTQRKHHEGENVGFVMLSGGGANLFGLEEYLSYQLNLPVRTANPWTNIVSFDRHVPELHSSRAVAFTSTLGLALRGVERTL
ncbi:MAG: type IV pilus assembly protein PilM [Parcubacteria group bacterium]|nr:type IV pilus assembly protein PilM [Parcubacteria group bacterium]